MSIMLYVMLLCTAARGQCPWPDDIECNRLETYRMAGAAANANAPAELEYCKVCLVAPRQDFAMVPCGHACFCERCAVRVAEVDARCPVCRTEITMVMRLFK